MDSKKEETLEKKRKQFKEDYEKFKNDHPDCKNPEDEFAFRYSCIHCELKQAYWLIGEDDPGRNIKG